MPDLLPGAALEGGRGAERLWGGTGCTSGSGEGEGGAGGRKERGNKPGAGKRWGKDELHPSSPFGLAQHWQREAELEAEAAAAAVALAANQKAAEEKAAEAVKVEMKMKVTAGVAYAVRCS